MVNWLLKKTRDPVVQIDKEGYEKLAAAGSVAFVFHGDLSTNAEAHVLNQIAMADDYNSIHHLIQPTIGEPNSTLTVQEWKLSDPSMLLPVTLPLTMDSRNGLRRIRDLWSLNLMKEPSETSSAQESWAALYSMEPVQMKWLKLSTQLLRSTQTQMDNP